ncbi:MAG: hypothetical protein AAGF95_23535 [Chloroflexota bacterium]
MTTRRLRIVAVCTLVLVPLVAIIVLFQFTPRCYYVRGCYTSYDLLVYATQEWLNHSLPYSLFILTIYGVLLLVHAKVPLFPAMIAQVAPVLVILASVFYPPFVDWLFLIPMSMHLTVYGLFLGLEIWRQRILIKYSTYAVGQNAESEPRTGVTI